MVIKHSVVIDERVNMVVWCLVDHCKVSVEYGVPSYCTVIFVVPYIQQKY